MCNIIGSSYEVLGSETCQDHWQSQSLSAGNPDVPYMVVSKSSVATSVCAEVLSCFRKVAF